MAVKSLCGVILLSDQPEALASFYAQALGLAFAREEHGQLAVHWGTDIGNLHFAIHPPANFPGLAPGQSSTLLAFEVDDLAQTQALLETLGAPCVQPVKDEGFGPVAAYLDPAGNRFEIVELHYDFAAQQA